MLKKKNLFYLLSALLVGAFPFLSAGTTVYAVEGGNPTVQEEDLEAMATELEYIFTSIVVEDTTTGEYLINEEELSNSSYSDEEKESFKFFAAYLNDPTIIEDSSSTEGMVTTAANPYAGCLADATGIAKGALNEVGKAIEQGNWLTAAGLLGGAAAAAGIPAISIAAGLIFLATCGATPAS